MKWICNLYILLKVEKIKKIYVIFLCVCGGREGGGVYFFFLISLKYNIAVFAFITVPAISVIVLQCLVALCFQKLTIDMKWSKSYFDSYIRQRKGFGQERLYCACLNNIIFLKHILINTSSPILVMGREVGLI